MPAPDTSSMVLANWRQDDEPGPPGRKGTRGAVWALPVSVVLHAVLFLAMAWTADHFRELPPPEPLPVEIVTLAPPEPAPAPPPPEPVKIPDPVPPKAPPEAKPVAASRPVPNPSRRPPAAPSPVVSSETVPAAIPAVSDAASAAAASSVAPAATVAGNGAPADEVGVYLAEIRRRLQASLDYPFAARRMKLGGTVHIRLRVGQDGAVEHHSVIVTASSGTEILDEAGVGTIHRAAPFPPPPGDRPLVINVPVVFELRRG